MLVKVTINQIKNIKIKDTVGIDLSKLSLDAFIHSNKVVDTFENSLKGFKELIKWHKKNSSYSTSETLFVFEHSGLYSYQISLFLTEQDIAFVMASGLAIKRSLGIVRGKNDRVDAKRIALYAYRLREETTPTKLPIDAIMRLKPLLSLRERLVKQRSGFKASYKEQKRVLIKKDHLVLLTVQEQSIKILTKQIKKVEGEMNGIIKEQANLKQIFSLLTSIKGIGSQTALFLIAYTEEFTKFKNSRKFASYCGIVPFPYSSGTSIRGRTKVSHLANKK